MKISWKGSSWNEGKYRRLRKVWPGFRFSFSLMRLLDKVLSQWKMPAHTKSPGVKPTKLLKINTTPAVRRGGPSKCLTQRLAPGSLAVRLYHPQQFQYRPLFFEPVSEALE